MALCTCQKVCRVKSNQKKDPSLKKIIPTPRTDFPSPSSSLLEHSLSSSHFSHPSRWDCLCGFSQRKLKYIACDGKGRWLFQPDFLAQVTFSTRSFVSLRQQSDSKGRYLHNIYISLIYATLYHLNQSPWAFSKELVAFPSALHAKLSANQESKQTTQQNTASQRRHQLSRILERASLGKVFSAVPTEPKQ